MRTGMWTGLVTASVAVGLCADAARGGIIFLSGDTNVTHALTGSFDVPIDPGNQQFFINILQGGAGVVVLETFHQGSVEYPRRLGFTHGR